MAKPNITNIVYIDEWSILEKVFLTSIMKEKNYDWVHICEFLKSKFGRQRPEDWYTPQTCAAQYYAMVKEFVDTKTKLESSYAQVVSRLKEICKEQLPNMEEKQKRKNMLERRLEHLENKDIDPDILDRYSKQAEQEEEVRNEQLAKYNDIIKERNDAKEKFEQEHPPPPASAPFSPSTALFNFLKSPSPPPKSPAMGLAQSSEKYNQKYQSTEKQFSPTTAMSPSPKVTPVSPINENEFVDNFLNEDSVLNEQTPKRRKPNAEKFLDNVPLSFRLRPVVKVLDSSKRIQETDVVKTFEDDSDEKVAKKEDTQNTSAPIVDIVDDLEISENNYEEPAANISTENIGLDDLESSQSCEETVDENMSDKGIIKNETLIERAMDVDMHENYVEIVELSSEDEKEVQFMSKDFVEELEPDEAETSQQIKADESELIRGDESIPTPPNEHRENGFLKPEERPIMHPDTGDHDKIYNDNSSIDHKVGDNGDYQNLDYKSPITKAVQDLEMDRSKCLDNLTKTGEDSLVISKSSSEEKLNTEVHETHRGGNDHNQSQENELSNDSTAIVSSGNERLVNDTTGDFSGNLNNSKQLEFKSEDQEKIADVEFSEEIKAKIMSIKQEIIDDVIESDLMAHAVKIEPEFEELSNLDVTIKSEEEKVGGTSSHIFVKPKAPVSKDMKMIVYLYKTISNCKYAHIFQSPISRQQVPGYHYIIRRPMDLSTIKKKIDTGQINSMIEFQRDICLMLADAKLFNHCATQVYDMTVESEEAALSHIDLAVEAAGSGLSRSVKIENKPEIDTSRPSRLRTRKSSAKDELSGVKSSARILRSVTTTTDSPSALKESSTNDLTVSTLKRSSLSRRSAAIGRKDGFAASKNDEFIQSEIVTIHDPSSISTDPSTTGRRDSSRGRRDLSRDLSLTRHVTIAKRRDSSITRHETLATRRDTPKRDSSTRRDPSSELGLSSRRGSSRRDSSLSKETQLLANPSKRSSRGSGNRR